MRKYPKTKEEKAQAAATNAAIPNPTAPLNQLKKYPLDRHFVCGDEVAVRLCYGRSNGIPEKLINTAARITKDEDSMGIAVIESKLLEAPISVPVCNLQLLRAVEDIPQFAIFSEGKGFFITAKGMAEAVAAFWYGGKTGILQKDALAFAELVLETLQQQNQQ